MKRVLMAACLCSTLLACGNVEEKAAQKLQAAREAFELGQYNEAKLLIDSIKLLYPKAFETRRAGITLMQQVELKEQEESLLYLDSLLFVKNGELNAAKKHVVFEKDSAYQEVGRYLSPTQVIEKNLHRSYLRFQVSETGELSMTSIYCGSRNIHHVGVKVTAPDGSFAETPAARDSYEPTDLAEKIEKADFKQGEDGGVIGFVALNHARDIRVNYLGERPYSTTLSASDRQAAAAVYELAGILSSITQIKKEMDEANLKISFVKKKMQENSESKEEKPKDK